MGGSALPGALLYDLHRNDPRLRKNHLHVVVRRDYELPPEATNSRAIVIAMSHSGNTEETVHAYRESIKRGLPTFVITTGGKLAKFSKKDGAPLILIPKGVEPRFAVGYQFGALTGLSIKLGFIPPSFKKEVFLLEKTLDPQRLFVLAKSLASIFRGKRIISLVYASPSLSSAAYSWKTNIHENAKLPSSFHVFPELNHNELNAFTSLTRTHAEALSSLAVIMLEDQHEHPRTKKRFRLTAQIIKSVGIPVMHIQIRGKSALLRLCSANLLGLAFSGVLAERLGIDPLPVPVIEDFKKKLK